MEGYSLGRAWAQGVDFVAGRARDHAIILIGVGVLLGTAVQYALIGGVISMTNPAAMAALDGAAPSDAAFAVAFGAGYLLQLGSFFASWRVGLARETGAGRAIGWGMAAALLLILGIAVLAFVLGLVGEAALVLAGILQAVIWLPFFVILYPVLGVLVGLGFLFTALFGLLPGPETLLHVGAGDRPVPSLVMLAAALLLLWLSARLCCTGPAMARRGTFNPLPGIAESWRLTGPAQWRILGYLSIVAVLLGLLLFVAMGLVGTGMAAAEGAGPQLGPIELIVCIVGGIGLAYANVTVPAGIYRAASQDAPENVFA